MINTIWVSTAPRTGSMWVFNVVRDIFRITGKQVEPENIPQHEDEMARQATQFAFESEDLSKVWVLKVHAILKPDLPRSKIITIHRDLRDELVSFKEFMNTSFDNSLDCARALVNFTETYKDYDSGYLKLVVNNDIDTRPVELILEIARFLEVHINETNARDIAFKYSREQIKNIIENTDNSLAQKLAKKQPIDNHDVVYFSESNYRAFDRKSGFQTGHVSNRKTGDWNSILSSAEQQRLHAEFGSWLRNYGYQV